MSKVFYNIATLALLLLFSNVAIAKESKNTSSIKARMIQESINSYYGNCPCPYNYAKNGSKCGKRSAWYKPGGYAPLCFEDDITNEMVDAYLKNN
jgi:hypothetical protein